MIDVSRAWSGKVAVETARRLEPYKLYWIEEPVRLDDEPLYMRMVQEATSAIVAGAEGEGTLYGIRRLINEGALQLVQTDILIGGGYTGLMRIAALCERVSPTHLTTRRTVPRCQLPPCRGGAERSDGACVSKLRTVPDLVEVV